VLSIIEKKGQSVDYEFYNFYMAFFENRDF